MGLQQKFIVADKRLTVVRVLRIAHHELTSSHDFYNVDNREFKWFSSLLGAISTLASSMQAFVVRAADVR
jgi:hypothetical protein